MGEGPGSRAGGASVAHGGTAGAVVPLREFVVKAHGRCDLACDYCYVYTMADQSWRSKPVVMAPGTVAATLRRIGEHVVGHGLGRVRVVLHGGEPLLAGPGWFDRFAGAARAVVPAEVELVVQTNGVLLDEVFLGVFAEHGVRVGVSLDGDRVAHDRHRRRANGRGSFDSVARALSLLGGPGYRGLFAGVLCTVDLANDPVWTYERLLDFAPPAVDLLLPHGNWTLPPPGRRPGTPDAPYAEWLAAVFDRWYGAAVRETGIRLFEEIVVAVLGGSSRTESVGLAPATLAVVDTDGSIEQVDTLKSAFDGAPSTGLSVFTDSFDAVLAHPGVAGRQRGVAGLCAPCRGCPVVDVCGGGYYPHRYRAGSGFDNPSVYCPDLARLIGHIAARVRTDVTSLAESLVRSSP